MPDQSSLEERLATLEQEVAYIKRQLSAVGTNGNWVDEVSGSMKPFPEFDDVVRLGREFRESTDDPDA